MSYSVYILECSDGTYYTGFTDNVEIRLQEHQIGKYPKSYTFNRRPVILRFYIDFPGMKNALAFEKQVKGWRREKKLALIEGRWDDLPQLSINYQLKNHVQDKTEK
jgi:putative endonuclease